MSFIGASSDDTLMTSTLVNMFESLTLVNLDRYHELQALAKDAIEFGSLDITNEYVGIHYSFPFTGVIQSWLQVLEDTVIVLAKFKSRRYQSQFQMCTARYLCL